LKPSTPAKRGALLTLEKDAEVSTATDQKKYRKKRFHLKADQRAK